MFKRFLAIMISSMMLVSPVTAFAETESITPEKEEVIEASEPAVETEEDEEKGSVIETESMEEEVTLPAGENKGDPLTKTAIQPRVPASDYPFRAMYPIDLSSSGQGEFKTEHISSGEGGGVGTLKTTYITKQLHNSGQLNLTIKQIGYLRSGTEIYVEGATKEGGQSSSDEVDHSTGATTAWTHPYKFTDIDPDISQLVITMAGTPVQASLQDRHERILIVNFDDGRGPALCLIYDNVLIYRTR